ncbi:hypothetical protein ABPG74_016425 [Tetrahymena malaccensis]
MEKILNIKNQIFSLLNQKKVFYWVTLIICSSLYINRRKIGSQLYYYLGYLFYKIETATYKYKKTLRPDKIIIVRHGESQANINDILYAEQPDSQIELTQNGFDQSLKIGQLLKQEIGENKNLVFFVSPYQRAQQTAQQIMKSFNKIEKIIIEPRIREQEWGNLQKFQLDKKEQTQVFIERQLVGRFYYRFKQGESASDVYDRVSLFLESLFREMDSYSQASKFGKNRVFVIVTHGMVMRLLLMRYFKQGISDFEQMENPLNCECWILKKDEKGLYKFDKKIQLEQEQNINESSQ